MPKLVGVEVCVGSVQLVFVCLLSTFQLSLAHCGKLDNQSSESLVPLGDFLIFCLENSLDHTRILVI